MWLLRMGMDTPERIRHIKHHGIISLILAQICSQAVMQNIRFTIHKVRAHIGVAGNERADAAANAAAGAPPTDESPR